MAVGGRHFRARFESLDALLETDLLGARPQGARHIPIDASARAVIKDYVGTVTNQIVDPAADIGIAAPIWAGV
jgi:hypothetical protein